MLLVYSVGGRLPPRAEAQGWWWPGQRRRRALAVVLANQREERAGRLAPQAPAELTLGRDTERRSVGSRSLWLRARPDTCSQGSGVAPAI